MENNGYKFACFHALLETGDLSAWSEKLPDLQSLAANPREGTQALLDFYMEVYNAADLFGECVIVEMNEFLDPTTHIPFVKLSTTEHSRIASALWVYKIFCQLETQVRQFLEVSASDFIETFMKNLEPWQLEQMVSLEVKLEKKDCVIPHQVEYAGPMRADLLERVHETPYAKSIMKRLNPTSDPFRPFSPFSQAVTSVQHRSNIEWRFVQFLRDREPRSSLIADSLQNYIWITRRTSMQTTPSARYNKYTRLCRFLGLYFWDYDRLVRWQVVGADDVMAAAQAARTRGILSELSKNDSLLPLQRLDAEMRRKERQIIEWTRSFSANTLDEWVVEDSC